MKSPQNGEKKSINVGTTRPLGSAQNTLDALDLKKYRKMSPRSCAANHFENFKEAPDKVNPWEQLLEETFLF